jgi:hypothetical protein
VVLVTKWRKGDDRGKLHLPVTLAVTTVGAPCRVAEGGERLGAPGGVWGGSGEECEEGEWAEGPFICGEGNGRGCWRWRWPMAGEGRRQG